MKCDDCEQREAEYRVYYKSGATAVFCPQCYGWDVTSIELAKNLEFAERIADGELVRWGRNRNYV